MADKADTKDIEKRVLATIADVLTIETDTLNPGDLLQEDLGMDSVDSVSLMLALEDEFGGVIAEEELEQFKTVGDIQRYIASRSDTQSA